jgi:hypothetical protein
MSLARLLSAGKSLMGGVDNTIRYQMGNPGMLPKFGSGRNPFGSDAKQLPPIQLTQPPGTGAEPHPVLSPPTAEALQQGEGSSQPQSAVRAPTGSSSGPAEKKHALHLGAQNFDSNILSIWKSWLGMVKRRSPWTPKHAKTSLPTLTKPLVQPELSLDKVRVVRNDLSDTDLEVITKPGRKDPKKAGISAPASSCPDELQSSASVVTRSLIAGASTSIGIADKP